MDLGDAAELNDLHENRGHLGVARLVCRAPRECSDESLFVDREVGQARHCVVQRAPAQLVEDEGKVDQVARMVLQRGGSFDHADVVTVWRGVWQFGDDAADELALPEQRGDQDPFGVQFGQQQSSRRARGVAGDHAQAVLGAQPSHVGLARHLAYQVADLLLVDEPVAETDREQRLLVGHLEHADDHDLRAGDGRCHSSDLSGGAGDGALAGARGVQVEQGLGGLRVLAHADQVGGLASQPVLEAVDDRLEVGWHVAERQVGKHRSGGCRRGRLHSQYLHLIRHPTDAYLFGTTALAMPHLRVFQLRS